MILTEVYNNWKAEKSKTIKPTSFSTYVLLMEKHVLPQLGDKETLSQEEVEALQEKLMASGASEKTAFDCAHLLMGSANINRMIDTYDKYIRHNPRQLVNLTVDSILGK